MDEQNTNLFVQERIARSQELKLESSRQRVSGLESNEFAEQREQIIEALGAAHVKIKRDERDLYLRRDGQPPIRR